MSGVALIQLDGRRPVFGADCDVGDLDVEAIQLGQTPDRGDIFRHHLDGNDLRLRKAGGEVQAGQAEVGPQIDHPLGHGIRPPPFPRIGGTEQPQSRHQSLNIPNRNAIFPTLEFKTQQKFSATPSETPADKPAQNLRAIPTRSFRQGSDQGEHGGWMRAGLASRPARARILKGPHPP